MSELYKAIASRQSTFPDQFMDKEITQDVLERLLAVANYAPSHKKTFPWRFVVFTGEHKIRLGQFLAETYQKITPQEKFSEFKHNKIAQKATQSGAVLAICMQRDPKERVPEWEEVAATAMAVQNIWLHLDALGLGGYWSTPILKDYFKDFVHLPAGQQCLGFFYLGYKTGESESSKKNLLALNEYVTFSPERS